MIREEFLWAEKYRPKTIDDTILPEQIKAEFRKFVEIKNVPNLILTGNPGMGKTTIARAVLDEIGAEYIIKNGSKDGNIDTLRHEVQNFASSVSFAGGRKYVIFDEADGINANSTQPALRAFMEEFSNNCGFIMTCNNKGRLIDALHSRCSIIDFNIGKSPQLAVQFMKRVGTILETEGVTYDKKVLAEVIMKFYPDFRRVLNELQTYGVTNGTIDTGILTAFGKADIQACVALMKDKNYTALLKWVSENCNDPQSFYRQLYDDLKKFITIESVPNVVLIIAKYMAAQSVDQEIQLMAALTEIMVNVDWA